MILLSGHSLTQARKIPLESLSLRLSERESTASMTPVSMDGIGTASWFLDETEPGKGIVWRVRSIQTAYATNTPTVQLEHVISCLKDRILFGSYEASDISGGETATAEQAIRFILSKQSDWRLGRCEYNFAAPYKFDGENLYDAIAKVTGTLDDSWWDLDTSTYPFVINIIRRPSGAACEMRPGRNLSAISRTIDTSGMYTRFYPIGADDLHIGTQFIGQNESAYGVREKVEVDQELTTEAELISWAREKLSKHAQPVINITAEGVELAAATGESLDKLTLGRICRVPLQEFGTIIEERITQLEYSDKIHNPEKVRITMSNARTDRDILHLLADELKNGGGAGGRGARTSTRKSKEDHAWFEDTDSHVAMVARGIIGTDAHGKPNWERLSRLEVNENGIYGEVKSVQNDVVLHAARLEVNEKAIQAEVEDRTKGDQINAGMLDIQSDRVGLLVGQRENRRIVTVASFSDLSGYAGDTARIYYVANERKYYEWKNGRWIENVGPGNYINAGGIVSAINGDGSITTRILGDKVLVGNNVEKTLASLDLPDWMNTTEGLIAEKATIADLRALRARVGTLEADAITTQRLSSEILSAKGLVIRETLSFAYGQTSYTMATLMAGISAVQIVGPTNNRYTLQYKNYGNNTWQDAQSFSRATTLQAEYGGDNTGDTATYKVTASPQGNETTGYFTVKQSKAAAYIKDRNGMIRARIDNPQYSNGWAAAYGKVSLPSASSTADNFSVSTPPSAVDGAAVSTKYTLSNPQNDVAVVKNPAGTIVARLEHGKYTAGYTQGKSDGYDEYYPIDYTEITCGSPSSDSGDISGRYKVGEISRPSSRSYIKFSATCRGKTRLMYIVVN